MPEPTNASTPIESPLLADIGNIVHGFGSRAAPLPAALRHYWPDRPTKQQVHGTDIALVRGARQECGPVDGLLTAAAGVLLTVVTADCVPVLLARRDGRRVAALHIGWRGTLAGMVTRASEFIRHDGDSTADWYAAIGPCARPCCYKVSSDLATDFRTYAGLPADIIEPMRDHLNLPGIIGAQLRHAGFGEISDTGGCTICNREATRLADFRFHSYRREQGNEFQWSGILIRA